MEATRVRIRLLPSSTGREPQLQCLTSFLIDDGLAIDGGSIGFALGSGQIGAVRHIIVTHSHADHTASLPIYVAESFNVLNDPIIIHGSVEVISALRKHVFNDDVWPDFEKIQLNNGSGPTVEFRELRARQTINIAGIDVTPIPVNHLVPTFGLLAQNEVAAVVFTSDTYSTDEIWEVAREAEHLKAVFVDVSFPNELGELAAASKHLTPELLAVELKKLKREVEVYAVHIKPTNRKEVIQQIAALGNPRVSVAEIDRVYEW
jgi:cAMP phosphodiesterase